MSTYPRAVRAVYTANVTLKDGKPGARLQMLDDNGIVVAEDLTFARKTLAGSFIGGVYEFEQITEETFRIAGRKYIGTYSNVEDVAAWQLAAKAQEANEEAKRMEKKDKAIPAALEMLKPLRRAYQSALPVRRQAIELLLLDYLRRRD